MRTLLPLEDALDNSPNMLSMVGVFEEDAKNLWSFVMCLRDSVKRLVDAQAEVASASQQLSQVLASFAKRELPLDQAAYDVPDMMAQLESVCSDVAGWMQLIVQQMNSSVQVPIKKLDTELDALLGPISQTYHEADSELEAAEQRHAKLTRRDSSQKINQSTSDVFNAKMRYHKRALQYFTRLNALQFTRYTLVIEPLVALMYTLRTYFNTGIKTMNEPKLSEFFSRTQEQMQAIHTEAAESASKAEDVHKTVAELQRLDPTTIYSPELSASGASIKQQDAMLQKQGYLHVKSRTMMMTHWDRYFMFTQGSNLMCQKRDDLAGQLLLDLSEPATLAGVVDTEERRFTFCIHTAARTALPSTERTRTLIFQARNEHDMQEWVTVINNLAHNNNSSQSNSPVKEPLPQSEPATPPSTPAAVSAAPSVDAAPIQFDFNGGSVLEPVEDGDAAEAAVGLRFEVRFLGCTQVSKDRGDRIVYDTINRIRQARSEHNLSSAQLFDLDMTSQTALRLIHREKKLACLSVPLSEISYWATDADDDKQLGIITRSRRVDDGLRVQSTFTCYVFSTEQLSGSIVCDALSECTRAAFAAASEAKANQIQQEQQQLEAAVAASLADMQVNNSPTEAEQPAESEA